MPATKIVVEREVEVPMRDGAVLRADLVRPAGDNPVPTLIQRLPYNKELPSVRDLFIDVMRAAAAGYAVLTQDTRGRYSSDGGFVPFHDDARDGADTLAWAARQPWSSGSLGMIGGSYYGATQWLAATEAHPALKAIAPSVTSVDYYESWAYRGGAFQLGFCLYWCLLSLATGETARRVSRGQASATELLSQLAAADAFDEISRRMPLTDVPELRDVVPYYLTWLEHPSYDHYWRAIAPRERFGNVIAPALNIGGWYDLFLPGTLQGYTGMRSSGGSPAARRPHLLIGPWAHGNRSGEFSERLYGVSASYAGGDAVGAQLRWFDRHLRGGEDVLDLEAPVRLFVMGADLWRDEQDWPLPDTSWTAYHLRVDGGLTPEPAGNEDSDIYAYDPRDPVPTLGGASFLPGMFVAANSGPRDQRPLAGRADILSFTTAPLEHPLEVTGPIELVLFVSSSARDTDFLGKLVDVHPDGRAELLTDGILRARYRESLAAPVLMETDHVYELRLDLGATANVFALGHRIRLDVSSSNFPRFDRNTNTGGTIAHERLDEAVVAINRIHHDHDHPSRLILPVIERQ